MSAEVVRAQDPIALRELILLLQVAYSGELGAARAYVGHHASVRRPDDRAGLKKILRDEVHHRWCLKKMLDALGSAPDARRERKMDRVGKTISTLCLIGGWFVPMYGAGKLESQNI